MGKHKIFRIHGAIENFKGIVIPRNTTKVIHTLGRLTSLDGIENFPPTVIELDISYNFVYRISGIEKTNIVILKMNSNNLESLEDLGCSKVKKLKIRGNPCEGEFRKYGGDILKLKEYHTCKI